MPSNKGFPYGLHYFPASNAPALLRKQAAVHRFRKVVSDLLAERSLLTFNEADKIAANIGKTQSQGFELTINTTNFNSKDFSWNITTAGKHFIGNDTGKYRANDPTDRTD